GHAADDDSRQAAAPARAAAGSRWRQPFDDELRHAASLHTRHSEDARRRGGTDQPGVSHEVGARIQGLWRRARHRRCGRGPVVSGLPPIGRPTIAPLECISEGWNRIRDQYWLFVGIAAAGILLGSLVPLGILMGAMLCGIYFCCMEKWRGRNVTFNALF